MSDQKIFCGSGKEFGQYGQVGLNICLEDIPAEFKQPASNGKTYLKLNLARRKQPDQHGNTHYITVNTWKPNQQQAPQQTGPQPQPVGSFDMQTGETVPF